MDRGGGLPAGGVEPCRVPASGPFTSSLRTPFQNKVEDRLDEAIHVLRSHAVGTAADGHGLLPGHGALASGFPGSVLPLGGRHASLVSAV